MTVLDLIEVLRNSHMSLIAVRVDYEVTTGKPMGCSAQRDTLREIVYHSTIECVEVSRYSDHYFIFVKTEITCYFFSRIAIWSNSKKPNLYSLLGFLLEKASQCCHDVKCDATYPDLLLCLPNDLIKAGKVPPMSKQSLPRHLRFR